MTDKSKKYMPRPVELIEKGVRTISGRTESPKPPQAVSGGASQGASAAQQAAARPIVSTGLQSAVNANTDDSNEEKGV